MHLQVVAVDKLTADLLAWTEEMDGTVSQILALGLMAQPDRWAPATREAGTLPELVR